MLLDSNGKPTISSGSPFIMGNQKRGTVHAHIKPEYVLYNVLDQANIRLITGLALKINILFN